MKLKNTLGLYICSLLGGIREDRPVVELHPDVNAFPRAWLFQVVVAGWVVHRILVNYVESNLAEVSLMTKAPDWLLNRKHYPTDADGDSYIGPKLTRNGRGAVPVIASGHSSMTADCRPRGMLQYTGRANYARMSLPLTPSQVDENRRQAYLIKLADGRPFFDDRFDIGQLPVRMIQTDQDSWLYDMNQPLPYQIPVQDFLAQQLKGVDGGFRRGEMITMAAFSQPQHKVDLTKHYFHKV